MALMVRTQFGDLYLADALPSIRYIIQDKYEQYADMIPNCFSVDTSTRSIEQSTGISGFGRFVTKTSGQPASGDLAYQRFDKTFTHTAYALEFGVTKEMIDDDEFSIIGKFASSLAKSAFDTKQTLAADIFNSAFTTTYTGGDGLALCSASHTLVAGTASNTLSAAADLSVTSLRQACQDIQDTVDDRGLLINLMPKYLLVPNEEQWNAHELLKSPDRPDTPNRAVNAFQMKNFDYLVWNYLTDPDAWFLLTQPSDHDLHWYNREDFNTIHYEDNSARAVVTQGYMRFSFGWNDWRGIYGSPGA